ncbi:hypothetical protein BT69DRAFT_1260535 [Atractiella rhizophila]|nr:hypothetical protein BT69DRAFT_1260535 [Atractiella rhizophila]
MHLLRSLPRTATAIRTTHLSRLRFFSASAAPRTESDVERAVDEVDVLIIGSGPSGLSASIRLKQLDPSLRVLVLEKGASVGSHILSGAVIETRALDELLPDWRQMEGSEEALGTEAREDEMRWLTEKRSFRMPAPSQMKNKGKGNRIVSLSGFVRWLGEKAEELEVEIYPGFAGKEVVWSEDGKSVLGVRTNDMGISRLGEPKDGYEPGMEFRAKCTLFAEGARGSLSERVIEKLRLREGKEHQTYGLGVKEVWRVREEKHREGKVVHTMGWPLDARTYGGSFLYHMKGGLVSLGLVVGLDYPNPHMSPFKEFQRMKLHPYFRDILEGGECIAYGGRVINEGGYQSIPKLAFPGGALIGCSAGFVNVPKIKGTHTAMQSGILAAEAIHSSLSSSSSSDEPLDISSYDQALRDSWVSKELWEVRNIRPSFHFSRSSLLQNPLGILYSGIDSLILKGRVPWTLSHPKKNDAQLTELASQHKKIEYPPADGKIAFDILTSVSRTATDHEEDQPCHLQLMGEKEEHTRRNVNEFGGLLGNACPAGVYEYVDVKEAGGEEEGGTGKRFVRNAQNCIHCKTCDIKTPTEDIRWTVPEGSGGPKYVVT